MPILVTCAGCRTRMNAPDTAAGRKVKCPKCGEVVEVPSDRGTSVAATLAPPNPSADATLEKRGDGAATQLTQGATTLNTASSAVPTLPGYEMLGELGRGGMGVVYKARQIKANRVVALKMILTSVHASVQEQVRFQIEAESVARLHHPHIVHLHEVGEHDGMPYFSLEFCDGGSLDHKLKTWTPTAAESVSLVETLARAMHFAHLHGVVHRDLKPANVLLAACGFAEAGAKPQAAIPKITDFGLAKQLDSGSDISRSGAIMGTPSYMSPEQAEGKVRETGPATDVYALGAILYELLAGRPPFRGETAFETMQQVLTEEPTPPSRLRKGVPRDLETICLKCLRKQPERRYASAEALAEDLRRHRQGEPITARPTGRVERAVKWARRRPAVAALLLVTVLGVAGIVWKYLDAERQKGIAEKQTELAEVQRKEAEQQKGIAEEQRQDAETRKQQAETEAAKAKKARDFLVSIFRISETDIQGGNITARQILADAERRIPVEFADQEELRAELMKAVGDVKRGIARRTPQAMILNGGAFVESAGGVKKNVLAQALVNLDDRLTLPEDVEVELVFLSDLHRERLKPGRVATVGIKGCEPADAVLSRDDGVLMTFVKVPKGSFHMGWDGTKKSVKTDITADFEIAVHAVTQGQWQAVMGSNPSHFSRTGAGSGNVKDISDEELKLFPVDNVSWDDVQPFLKKLNERERGRGWSYRLPTEAEWEYSCRGAPTSERDCTFHFYTRTPSNDLSSEQANFNGNHPAGTAAKGKHLQRTTRVGSYPPNGLGLCDMHGNVWQWCEDRFFSGRVFKGGSWDSLSTYLRAGYRSADVPTTRSSTYGLRLVRVPSPPQGK